MTSPDPVRDAQAYQQSLLDALGDDDPAEAQATTPDRIRRLIAASGPDLRTKPAPREWSVLACIGHVTDAEIVMSARYRWVLAHDEPELIGYDQDLWIRPNSSRSSRRSEPRTSRSGIAARRSSGRGSATIGNAARRATT